MHWLLAALLVFIFQAATILVLEYRRPSNAMAWLFILFLFPTDRVCAVLFPGS